MSSDGESKEKPVMTVADQNTSLGEDLGERRGVGKNPRRKVHGEPTTLKLAQ
jgi:hypothetical protein